MGHGKNGVGALVVWKVELLPVKIWSGVSVYMESGTVANVEKTTKLLGPNKVLRRGLWPLFNSIYRFFTRITHSLTLLPLCYISISFYILAYDVD